MHKTVKHLTLTVALLLSLWILLAQNEQNLAVQAQNTGAKTTVEGKPSQTVTIISPQNKVYNADDIKVTIEINSTVPPLEAAPVALFQPFFRYGCYLDYDIMSSRDIDLEHWNPNRAGFIASSNVNITITQKADCVWVCSASIANLNPRVTLHHGLDTGRTKLHFIR